MSGESERPTVAGPSENVPVYQGQGEACVEQLLDAPTLKSELKAHRSNMAEYARSIRDRTVQLNLMKATAAVNAAERDVIQNDITQESEVIRRLEVSMAELTTTILELIEQLELAENASREVSGK